MVFYKNKQNIPFFVHLNTVWLTKSQLWKVLGTFPVYEVPNFIGSIRNMEFSDIIFSIRNKWGYRIAPNVRNILIEQKCKI